MSYLDLINECWSRGFDHANYIHYADGVFQKTGVIPHTVSKPVYDLICGALTMDMEQNIGVLQPDGTIDPLYPNGLMF